VPAAETDDAKQPQVELAFAVSDTGPGILPDEIDHVFETFGQTESGQKSREGTGLGLPISRGFVRMLGGDITVQSEAGKGTTFHFHIPVTVRPDLEARREKARRVVGLAPEQPGLESPPRLLLVDDQPENLLLLHYMLAPLGFALRTAVDGLEAVEQYKAFSPHCILMDIRMPRLNGFDAARRIKALSAAGGPPAFIIALTASSLRGVRAKCLEAGCDDYLIKPFAVDDLFDILRRRLDIRFIYAEPEELTIPADSIDLMEGENPLRSANFESWPRALTAKFKDAIITADLDAALEAVSTARINNYADPATAARLEELLQSFRFDLFLELFETDEPR
jgi:CheY-like chemotaxis protein